MSSVAFITGTTSGIGHELTKGLLQKGYAVIASGRKAKANAELKSLQSDYKDKLKIVDLDVTSDEDIQRLASELKDYPSIDFLINNAGIFVQSDEQILEKSNLDDILKTFLVNTMGPIKITKALLPKLKASAKPTVINITSQMGSIEDNKMGRYYGYRASKAALNMFTKSFTIDYPQISSIVVHPGWVQTKMGGSAAPTTPVESANGIIKLIEGLKSKDSGKFFDFRGETLPW